MAAKETNGSAVTVKKNNGTGVVTITGGNGADTINADALFNSVAAGTSYEIVAGNGADVVNGSSRNEIIWGDSSGSSSTSDNGADTLNGGGGDDKIHGGNGGDAITGDAGYDQLWGDRGPDRFIYKAVGDSVAFDNSKIDIIEDFESPDKLDFTLLPLSGGSPPPELQWLGNAASGGAYGLWWDYHAPSGFTRVFADTNGDGIADLEVHLRGKVNLLYGDFLGINIAPDANNDANSVLEDASASGSVAANDSDLDGDTLTYSLNAPVAGLTLNGNGSYSFDAGNAAYQHLAAGATTDVVATYTVNDGHGGTDSATLTITVTGVNDAPEADDDSDSTVEDGALVLGSVAGNDSDVDDGAVLAYALVNAAPAGFSMDGAGNWSFDPSDAAYQSLADGEPLTLTIDYTVTDEHGASDTATLTIDVTGANDAPVAADDNDSAVEDGALVLGSVAANDDDVDNGAVLTYALVNAAPAGFSMDGDGNWTFDPSDAAYQSLADGEPLTITIDYTVTDEHGASDTATLTIDVTGVNDAPVAADDSGSAVEDGALVLGSVATNDDDVDNGAVLTYALVDAAPAGFSMDGDGNWTFDPSDAAYQSLADGAPSELNIAYTVTDEHGASDTATLTISLTGTNDAPVAADDNGGSATEDGAAINGTVATNDDDVDDGAVLSYALVDPAPAGFAMDGAGNWTFNPANAAYQSLAAGEPLVLNIAYTVTDEHGASDTATLTINVTGVNDAATFSGGDSGSVTEDGTLIVGGTLSASDVDGPDAINAATLAGVYGSFTINAAGVWSYTLNNGDSDLDDLDTGESALETFTVSAVDGTTHDIVVTVNGANETPPYTSPPIYTSGGDPNDFDTPPGSPAPNNATTVSLGGGDDTFVGGPADQNIDGNNGIDTIYGNGGNDTIGGNNDADNLYGNTGNDKISGNNANDKLYGGSGNDELIGGGGNDTLYGGSNTDTIDGGGDNDLIVGGYGADTLTGGTGNDTFRYLSAFDTGDTITDFAQGADKIDLAAFTPSTFIGAIGSPGAVGAGQVGYISALGVTTVYVDIDGIAGADLEIKLTGTIALVAGDFIL